MTSKLVKKTAKELAGAFFDGEDTFRDGRLGRTQTFRQSGLTEKQFVAQYWPDFVVVARKILAHMLTEPGRTDMERNEIYDALLQERGLMTDAFKAAPSILRVN